MRNALLRKLVEHMERDPSLHLLTSDTGFHVFDDFPQRFGDRYINVGISEAGMISLAAGMAIEGKRVFCYGIVPFVTMRCFEQIRVDLAYPRLPVTVVGVGAGLTYGPAGVTHHAIEDIAIMAALPNMTVIAPGDPVEAESAVEALMTHPGPCYLRLGKTGEPVVHARGLANFEIGRAIRVREGEGVGIVSTGNLLPMAVSACDRLAERGRSPALLSMPTVKPFDAPALLGLANRCDVIATVEEHNLFGGLGSIAAGALADAGACVRLVRCGVPDEYAPDAASQECLQQRYGLTGEGIASRILATLGRKA